MGTQATNGTLCWRCHKAAGVGGWCPWSAHFKPVPGWDAIPTFSKSVAGNVIKSYEVKECPLFVPDPPRNKTGESIILSKADNKKFKKAPIDFINNYETQYKHPRLNRPYN